MTFDFEAEEDTSFLTEELPDYRDFHERQFGGRRGIWRTLAVLRKHEVRSTFFICGAVVENYPEASLQVKADGHEVAGHTYHHEHMEYATAEQEDEIFRRSLEAFEQLYGEQPVGFRTCFPSHRTLDYVADYGLRYDTTLRDDDAPSIMQRDDGRYFVEIPRGFNGDAPLIGTPIPSHGHTGKYNVPSQVAAQWIREFNWCYEHGEKRPQLFTLCLHPYIIGRPSRSKALDTLLAHIRQFSGVWFATHSEIAELWHEAYSPPVAVTVPTTKPQSSRST
jgi:peptidoglycan/xylan/chitin deacetylase (PgdA/CDA1 family)